MPIEYGIQRRSTQVQCGRPRCPRGCRAAVHAHGTYERYDPCSSSPNSKRIRIQRFLCSACLKTISVLLDHLLPYWYLSVERLESFADRQAGVGQGPDPPPDAPEAAALRRAWARFSQRVGTLRDCFGQLIASGVHFPKDLWIALRTAKQSLSGILLFLAQSHNTSLLGDYRCLRPG